jgi:predicted amidophosphoribosyltransferase
MTEARWRARSLRPDESTAHGGRAFALDLHTLSSEYVGDDEFGHPRFDTIRTEIGELLYQLKSKGDKTAVTPLAEALEKHLKEWKPPVDLIVPVPPSSKRAMPPVMILTEAVSKQTGIALADCVKRARDIPQLKNVTDLDERTKLLQGLHSVDKTVTQGRAILLFDDLYRSGATMNSIAAELRDNGLAADVYALTVTRTRSNR